MRLKTADAGDLEMWTNGAQRLTIQSGGNVGVGTTNPTVHFHVAGLGRFTADLRLDADLEIGGAITDLSNRKRVDILPTTTVLSAHQGDKLTISQSGVTVDGDFSADGISFYFGDPASGNRALTIL